MSSRPVVQSQPNDTVRDASRGAAKAAVSAVTVPPPLVTAAVSGRLLLSTLPSTQFGATAHYQTAILARRIVAPQNASIFVSWNGTMPERAAALHHQRDLAEVLVRLHVR